MTTSSKTNKSRKDKKEKIINSIGDGGCPCGVYNDGETLINAHCWRTDYFGCNCPFAGVHYRGKRTTAKRIADDIAEGYMCEVKIVKLK